MAHSPLLHVLPLTNLANVLAAEDSCRIHSHLNWRISVWHPTGNQPPITTRLCGGGGVINFSPSPVPLVLRPLQESRAATLRWDWGWTIAHVPSNQYFQARVSGARKGWHFGRDIEWTKRTVWCRSTKPGQDQEEWTSNFTYISRVRLSCTLLPTKASQTLTRSNRRFSNDSRLWWRIYESIYKVQDKKSLPRRCHGSIPEWVKPNSAPSLGKANQDIQWRV